MPTTTSPPPTRQTSEFDLDRFNDTLRQQPYVQQWLTQRGKVDTGRGVQLSENEREQFTQMLRRNGVVVPEGMKVDGAGNFNQTNRLWRNIGIGAAIGGAALTGLGVAGIGPLAGILGGAAPVAGGATTIIPGTGIPTVAGTGYTALAPALAGKGLTGTLGSLLKNPDVLGAAGTGLQAFSQGQAQNRGAQFEGQLDLERTLLLRDQEARAGEENAWRKLLASQRTLSPGARPQLSPYSVAPREATGAERQGAETLSAASLGRLQGGQRPASIDPSLLEAGTLEQILGYAGPALSVYGASRRPPPTAKKPSRVEYYEG